MDHLRAISTLLMVQGALELLAGFLGLAVAPGLAERRAGQVPADTMLIFVVVADVVILTCGALKVAAGYQNRRLKGRALGYAAFLSALPMICTGWCAPSGLAIMVYGFVVYG